MTACSHEVTLPVKQVGKKKLGQGILEVTEFWWCRILGEEALNEGCISSMA
jgi:hypothetical protein